MRPDRPGKGKIAWGFTPARDPHCLLKVSGDLGGTAFHKGIGPFEHPLAFTPQPPCSQLPYGSVQISRGRNKPRVDNGTCEYRGFWGDQEANMGGKPPTFPYFSSKLLPQDSKVSLYIFACFMHTLDTHPTGACL